jgi:hypothetical protein
MKDKNPFIARFDLEQRLRAVETLERTLVEQGRIPDTRKLLVRRTRILMEITGGLLLGMFVAIMALLMVFVVLNKAIHI